MVKQLSKLFLIITAFCFFNSCNIDLLGLVASNDLDERLKERNNFTFLENNGKTLSLDSSYSFVVVTDTHFEDGKDFGLKEKLKAFVENAANDIKFVVFLGDITQFGASKDINVFIDIASALSVPCYPVAGNHDIYFESWSVWKEKIGSTSYRIDDANDTTTLFVLDSANAFFGKDQLDWLDREIKNVNKNVFVFTHAPLFVKGPVNMQQVTDTRERARIVSIMRNKADIVFMGHLHMNLYNKTGNVMYVGVEDYVKNKAYCVVTVNDGGISYEYRKF